MVMAVLVAVHLDRDDLTGTPPLRRPAGHRNPKLPTRLYPSKAKLSTGRDRQVLPSPWSLESAQCFGADPSADADSSEVMSAVKDWECFALQADVSAGADSPGDTSAVADLLRLVPSTGPSALIGTS